MISFTKNVTIIAALFHIISAAPACFQLKNKLNDQLKKTFNDNDNDHDGILNIEEFRKIMNSIDENLTKDEIDKLFNKAEAKGIVQSCIPCIPYKGSGTINYEKFVAVIASELKKGKSPLYEHFKKMLFQSFDVDGDGNISIKDLRKIYSHYFTARDFMRQYDKNGNGKIDREEFEKIYKSATKSIS